MSEESFCGNYGRRCRYIIGHCDYHVEMGDHLCHERMDRKMEKEMEKMERIQDETKHGDREK